MTTEEIQAQLNLARDAIAAAVRNFFEATGQPIIGNFEAYLQADGRVDYRITADSQIIFKSNDSLDAPRYRVRVLEAFLACQVRAGAAPDAVELLNAAFDEWRLKPTRFSFQTFADSARIFGIRPTLD